MSDYISRQAAVEAIENTDWYHINGNGELVSGANSQEHEPLYRASEIYAALEEVPSAQPEIIRCKDCKHRPFDSEDGFEFPDERCPCQCEDFWYSWRPNNEWFCANAERRTDGVDR